MQTTPTHLRTRFITYTVLGAAIIFPSWTFSEGFGEEEVRTYLNKASPHPRLLMDRTNEDRVRETLTHNDTAKSLYKLLTEAADALLEEPPASYNKTGRRLLSVSREVLRRVVCLSFVYRMEGESAYAERAIAEMIAAATFSDWNPSHFLDAAEMTAALAIGYDWLHGRLTNEQEEVIRTAILKKGVAPSYDGHDRWVLSTNNWNQVCHGGLTLGVLALADHEPELAARVLTRALNALPLAMRAYQPDGIYPEGPGYWEYGTTYNVVLIAALKSALGTDFGLSETPGFLESGAFPLLMTGPTGEHYNFSDCGSRRGPFPAVFWFAERRQDPGLTWAEHPWLEAMIDGKAPSSNRFLPLLLIWSDFQSPIPPAQPLHWRGDGVNPLAVHRSSWTDPNAVYLAVKAGRPNAPHGHMDIGSFILEADGVRWALDFGMQGYHALEERGLNIWDRSQDSERWKIYRYHNQSHSTLMVDEKGQVVNASAPITEFSGNPDFPYTIMDMSDVYGGQLARAERGFTLLPDGRVLIQDELLAGDTPARVRWAMTTPAKIHRDDTGKAALILLDERLIFEVLSPETVYVEEFSTEPPNEWDAPNPGTRQVGFHVDLPSGTSTTLVVVLTPGSVYESGLKPPPVRPLENWPNDSR